VYLDLSCESPPSALQRAIDYAGERRGNKPMARTISVAPNPEHSRSGRALRPAVAMQGRGQPLNAQVEWCIHLSWEAPMTLRIRLAALALGLVPLPLLAQIGVPARPLPDSPFVIDTAEQGPVRVTAMTGLRLPWDLAFLPNGDLLVTERTERQLRLVRNGRVEPQPIAGLPEFSAASGGGLMSVKIHPQFADNGWVYLSYTKAAAAGHRAVGMSRGRLAGMRLTEVKELFSAEEPGGGPAPGLPLIFGPEGYLYMGIGGANDGTGAGIV
jgi:glucose/arabinose dehydrogenase